LSAPFKRLHPSIQFYHLLQNTVILNAGQDTNIININLILIVLLDVLR
jgi:hypothetical protein